jgi:hypothetical protein
LKTAHGGREGEKQCFIEYTGAAEWSDNKLTVTFSSNSSRFHANSKYWVLRFRYIYFILSLQDTNIVHYFFDRNIVHYFSNEHSLYSFSVS